MLDLAANAATRFAAISDIFDASTERHLLALGLARGWHCLEIGGGSGTVARWLSDQVGDTGHVVATDLDTRFLESIVRPNLDVVRHDITRDALPRDVFDLAHTRMLLIHLREPDEALRRMISALKPGGWLVCEEFDDVSAAPDVQAFPEEVALKTHAAMRRLRLAAGVHPRCGRRLFARFRSLGLTDLGADAHLSMIQPRTSFTRLLRASCELRRTAMIEAGYITEHEFEEDVARMDSPDFLMPSPTMWTVRGRKP